MLLLNDVSDGFWRRFVEGRIEVSSKKAIVPRWQRVAELGLPVDGPARELVVSQRELRERRDESEALVAAARPILRQNARLFAEHDFVLLLTDPRGLVLLRTAGGAFAFDADTARLIEGAEWSEPMRGTNAIGTALYEERPVGVVGAAHYARPNHALACYASPVRAPDGRVVGAVDATSHQASATRIVTLAVCGVARAIESALRASAENRVLVSLRPMLDRIPGPAIVVSAQGRVAYENESARARSLRGPLEQHLRRFRLAPGETELATPEASLGVRVERLSETHLLVSTRPSATPAVRSDSESEVAVNASVEEVDDPFHAIRGDDPTLQAAKDRAARFARTNLPVLLLAETGTGKELMARAIHAASRRRQGPFIALNCGAFSGTLLESELFGYGDAAFTGARPGGKKGKLDAAEGGTLFLDEIGEMGPTLQVALLRVLEDGTFHRVGEVEPRSVDLRLVCATCRDLPQMVADGRFRSDLYFRIRGACLGLPPLRERRDLLLLTDALLRELATEQGRAMPSVSEPARAAMARHAWPGNVRELKTALAHAMALADDEIGPEHLPAEPALLFEPSRSRDAAERSALLAALSASGSNLSEAARRLGIARSTLYRMMARHGVHRGRS